MQRELDLLKNTTLRHEGDVIKPEEIKGNVKELLTRSQKELVDASNQIKYLKEELLL